jgi:hypothetical protein
MNREGAVFSPCRRYRYMLARQWEYGTPSYAAFIGLNPSTADEVKDDPTIRCCVGFAKSWGLGGLVMLNLFAFRATQPKAMLAAVDPIGPDNDRHLAAYCDDAAFVIACWGRHGAHLGRATEVKALVPNLCCLALNKDGSPHHPLYLPKTLTPMPWKGIA